VLHSITARFSLTPSHFAISLSLSLWRALCPMAPASRTKSCRTAEESRTTCICKIFRNLKHCSKTLKEAAYTSLVRSVLDYSSTVWDPYLQKDIDRLESIQRRAARFVYNDYGRKTSITELMKKLDWKPLSERRREQRLIFMYKIVNNLTAIPAETHITPKVEVARFVILLICDDYFNLSLISSPRYGFSLTCSTGSRWLSSE
jgi:hypothetical protein